MDQKSNLNPRVQSTVKQYRKKLEDEGIPVSALIVFGSQAKGTNQPWSDIDLCVVSDMFGRDLFSERVKLLQLRDKEMLEVEPHPFSPADLANKWDPLASEIRKYGVKVP